MIGDYKPIIFDDFGGGLVTKYEDNKMKDNQTPDCQNVDFAGLGSIVPRKGYNVFGTSASSATGIKTMFNFKRYDGKEIPIRTYSTIMEYYNDEIGDWYELRDDFTAENKFGFTSYYSLTLPTSSTTPEIMLFCNGIDQPHQWNGLYGTLSGAHTNLTNGMFYLSSSNALSTMGWLSAGEANIDGELVYYSTLSGNALSGCTRPAAVSHTTQVGACQLPISSVRISGGVLWKLSGRGFPVGNIFKLHNNRLHVAGISGDPNSDYYSMLDDPTCFNYSSPLSAGDGGAIWFPEGGGEIKSLKAVGDNLIVLKEDTLRYLTFTSDDLPARQKIIDGVNIGALNHLATTEVENNIFFISPVGGVRSLKQTADNAIPMQVAQMSVPIEPTISDLNFTSASGVYHKNKHYLACADENSSFNNVVLAYDFPEEYWTKYIGINVGDWMVYNKELYFGASNEVGTYKFLSNYDDNELGYETYWKSKKIDFGVPNSLKRMRYLYVEGYMTDNTEIDITVYYNDGASNKITKTIKGTGTYVSDNDIITWLGNTIWAKGTYGGKIDTASAFDLKKFRVWLSFSNIDFYNIQIETKTYGAGYAYKVTHLFPYAAKLDDKKIPSENII